VPERFVGIERRPDQVGDRLPQRRVVARAGQGDPVQVVADLEVGIVLEGRGAAERVDNALAEARVELDHPLLDHRAHGIQGRGAGEPGPGR
jgi:hypothetical protein